MDGGDGERWKDSVEKSLNDLRLDVDNLKTWRAWILGSAAGIGVMFGAFAKQIGIVAQQFFK